MGDVWVEAYLDVFKHDWVDEDGPADTDGPASDTESVSLCAHAAGEDFCGDEESDGAPSGCVDEVEEEEHSDCGRSDAGCLGRIMTGGFVEGSGL